MKKEIIKFVSTVYSEAAKRSPTILTGFGVAGLVISAGEGVKAGMKIEKKLNELPEDTSVTDKAKAIAPILIPTIFMTVVSGACIIGARVKSSRREALLISAYSMSESAMKEFQDKAKELYGEKKTEKIKGEIVTDKIAAYPPTENNVINTGKGNTLFLDLASMRYFLSDMEFIRQVQNDVNEELLNGDKVTINTFYDMIMLPPTKFGDDRCWDLQFTGKMDIKFYPEWTDSSQTRTCIAIDFYEDPAINFV